MDNKSKSGLTQKEIKKFNWKVIESYFHSQHLERLVRHQLNLIIILLTIRLKQLRCSICYHSFRHDKDQETGLC